MFKSAGSSVANSAGRAVHRKDQERPTPSVYASTMPNMVRPGKRTQNSLGFAGMFYSTMLVLCWIEVLIALRFISDLEDGIAN
jgi:hypothetical protein